MRRSGLNLRTPGVGPAAEKRPVTAGTGRVHEVQAGDTLDLICRHYYRDASLADELAEYNALADPNSIRAGRSLQIPEAAELTTVGPAVPVVAGDLVVFVFDTTLSTGGDMGAFVSAEFS